MQQSHGLVAIAKLLVHFYNAAYDMQWKMTFSTSTGGRPGIAAAFTYAIIDMCEHS